MVKRRDFSEIEKSSYWYVDNLDPNRPTRRACSRDRWIKKIVNPLVERDIDGRLIHRASSVFGRDFISAEGADTTDWKHLLREIIQRSGFRMWWERKHEKEPRRRAPTVFD